MLQTSFPPMASPVPDLEMWDAFDTNVGPWPLIPFTFCCLAIPFYGCPCKIYELQYTFCCILNSNCICNRTCRKVGCKSHLENIVEQNKKTRWNSTGFCRRLCLCLLWPWPLTFWPQNLISISMNSNTSVTKIRGNSLHWFWDMVFIQVFGTHRLMHSRTHSQTDRTYTVCLWHHLSTAAEA